MDSISLPADLVSRPTGSRRTAAISSPRRGTQNPDTIKAWSPDGTQVLQRIDATARTYIVDPVTGVATELAWAEDMPDWQRR